MSVGPSQGEPFTTSSTRGLRLDERIWRRPVTALSQRQLGDFISAGSNWRASAWSHLGRVSCTGSMTMPRCGKAHRFRLGATAFALLFVSASSASAQTSDFPEVEALGSLGFGVSQRGGGPALAARGTLSASYWPSPFFGTGIEGGAFANETWGSSNVGCGAPTSLCGDPRDRTGWFIVPRLFVGKLWFVHWFAALGIGFAHEEFPIYPRASYDSWMASLEGGADVTLAPLSVVPSIAADAMDGGAALYLKLSLGLNF
jgi:hypothetical protein